MRELFNIPDCEYSGVYQIRNLRTSKIYIGSSSELKTRATVHKREIQKMRHSNKNINADAREWMEQHQNDLLEMWETQNLKKLPPL
ncbi:GIY-YIG nuclease family protein [Enterocloster clostridioformis]|uniref:GIY-YIG nuclease family protein n=1 Tax=Enterocloster clostridioformis TaxID=1531 RepID=UPI0018AA2C1D|nr:GIY-YIG nuclease family protein [Enterocloster clostridioformis]MDB2129520.1 GIY-YIG nuclease family protein [Enterocloster clostridioformis]